MSTNETRTDLASIAVSSPVQTRNRFSAIELQDEERDPLPHDEHESRRAKRHRRGSSAPQKKQQSPAPVEQTRQRGGRLSKSSSASKIHRANAAEILVDKSYFCVDNVNLIVSVDDLKSFVSGMHVNVLSCFPARVNNHGRS